MRIRLILTLIFLVLSNTWAVDLDYSKCNPMKHKNKTSKKYKLCKWGNWSVFYHKGKIRLAEYIGNSKIQAIPTKEKYQVKIYNPNNVSDYFVSKVSSKILLTCLACQRPLVLDQVKGTKKIVCQCK